MAGDCLSRWPVSTYIPSIFRERSLKRSGLLAVMTYKWSKPTEIISSKSCMISTRGCWILVMLVMKLGSGPTDATSPVTDGLFRTPGEGCPTSAPEFSTATSSVHVETTRSTGHTDDHRMLVQICQPLNMRVKATDFGIYSDNSSRLAPVKRICKTQNRLKSNIVEILIFRCLPLW